MKDKKLFLKKIYFITIPIGDHKDITLNALEALQALPAYVVETEKTAKKNLATLKIETKKKTIFSIKNYKTIQQQEELLKTLLVEYEEIGFIVDSGMPILADPGRDFLNLSISYNLQVIILGGVSSIPLALAYSSFPTDNHHYVGFLSQKKDRRYQQIYKLKFFKTTLIILESHHRLKRLLLDLKKHFSTNMKIYLGFALTMKEESHFRGSLKEAISKYSDKKNQLPFVLVLNNRKND